MREDILLLFLSPVKFGSDCKVTETHYTNVSGENTCTTNESAVRYLLENELSGKKLSKIFILASKAVRKEIENCPEKITHLEYFKNRVEKFSGNASECIKDETVCEYDEDIGGEYNLKSVAETAKKIQDYAKKSGNEIYLHVDLTGGMRHVNMMILDVIRLLEAGEIKIGKIIYSNYNPAKKEGTVEEINNIYDLFRLISGVEEFINFGSVEILNDYYKNHSGKKSDSLKNLLNAMKNFADAIKLCRYGQFKTAIENLHDSMHDFINNVPDNEKNLNDMLMERLIDRINREYEMLIATRGQDDLKIIRWCINKGYLQQALTLYTERVPEYIHANKFYTINPDEYKKVKKKLEKDVRNEGFYFLNNYLEKDNCAKDDEEVNNLQKAIQDFNNRIETLKAKYFEQIKKYAVPDIRAGKFSYDDWRKKLLDDINLPTAKITPEEFFKDEKTLRSMLTTLAELKQSPQVLKNLSDEKLVPIRPIIKEIFDELEKLPKGYLRRDKIFEFTEKSKAEQLKKFFPVFEFDTRKFRLKYMAEKKIFTLTVPKEKFLSIAEKYFRIKDERNHSNHARNDDTGEFSSAKELENFMLSGLDEIENAGKEKAI